MKLILTGGAGFIGSCVLWKLNSMGIEDVIVVDTRPDPNVYSNLRRKKFRAYYSREGLMSALKSGELKDVDGIIHMGACSDTTEKDWAYLEENNVRFSQTLATWCLDNKKFFHYASSAAIYGDGKGGYDDADSVLGNYTPLNLYGRSKWLFDEWIIKKELSTRFIGYRFFNVFGPNEYHKGEMRSMVAKAYDQIKETGRVKLFGSTREGFADGSEERDFVYIKDVLDVMVFFLQNSTLGGIYNLGTGKARPFKDLATAVFTAQWKKAHIDYIPMPDILRGHYQYFTQANIEKLRRAGYSKEFRSLEISVADYVQNYLEKTDPTL